MNRVSFVGCLATDPETRIGESHGSASFRLAIPRRRRAGGEGGGAVFVDVVSFDTLARNVGERLARGRRVAVSGRLEKREWTSEDGLRRSRLQMVADEVTFLGERKHGVTGAARGIQ